MLGSCEALGLALQELDVMAEEAGGLRTSVHSAVSSGLGVSGHSWGNLVAS